MINWPWKKRRSPDMMVVIEYFKAGDQMFVWAQPGEMDKDTLLFMLEASISAVKGTDMTPAEHEDMVHKIVSEIARDNSGQRKLRLVKK